MRRYDIINHFIKCFHYTQYLEIGVEDGCNIRFIQCENITGVDPTSQYATHKQTSDEFFRALPPQTTFDIIFIDGLHVEEQVTRDIDHSLEHLSPNGTIVVHDCNPPTAWHQRSYEEAQKNGCREWNGTVWRSIVHFRTIRSDLEIYVIDTDWGCGVIRRGCQLTLTINRNEITYDNFDKYRAIWLNLITPALFLEQ